MTTYPAAIAELDDLKAKQKLADELAKELVTIIDKMSEAHRALEVDLASVKRRLAYAELERDRWRAKASQ
jgi:hypothetical protein